MPPDPELDGAAGADGEAAASLGALDGAAGEARVVVGPGDTAIALGSGEVDVLGTPRLVALAEQATLAALAGRLEPDRTTVGSRVEIDHLAPSRLGDEVVAAARLVEVAGRRLRFEVTVTDATSEAVLARVVVARSIVDKAAFG